MPELAAEDALQLTGEYSDKFCDCFTITLGPAQIPANLSQDELAMLESIQGRYWRVHNAVNSHALFRQEALPQPGPNSKQLFVWCRNDEGNRGWWISDDIRTDATHFAWSDGGGSFFLRTSSA